MNVSNQDSKDVITEDADVFVVLDSRKNWLTKAVKGKQFHCHKGFFNFDQVIGKPYGIQVRTNKSVSLTIYKPLPSDFLTKIPHSSQIIYAKDAGMILINAGIVPGSTVLEAGSGSGALTSILANYVCPDGHVYSYEIREDAYKTTKKNIERLNLQNFVTLKHKDASEGFDESHVDAVVLDLGDPLTIIPHAYSSLRSSGVIAIFLPTYNQIEKVFDQLKSLEFGDIQALELIRRDIQLKTNAIRPKTRMIGHTGFLIFARKQSKGEEIANNV